MLTAGALLILQTALMLSVVVARRRARVSLGAGEDERLLRAIRRHGNLAENSGLFLVAFVLVELTEADRRAVAVLAAVFVLARVAHAVGLSMKRSLNPVRVAGVALTACVGFALAWRLMSTAAHGLLP
jgi:uncharacterized membrane protein YecN with MAPEG domain